MPSGVEVLRNPGVSLGMDGDPRCTFCRNGKVHTSEQHRASIAATAEWRGSETNPRRIMQDVAKGLRAQTPKAPRIESPPASFWIAVMVVLLILVGWLTYIVLSFHSDPSETFYCIRNGQVVVSSEPMASGTCTVSDK